MTYDNEIYFNLIKKIVFIKLNKYSYAILLYKDSLKKKYYIRIFNIYIIC